MKEPPQLTESEAEPANFDEEKQSLCKMNRPGARLYLICIHSYTCICLSTPIQYLY